VGRALSGPLWLQVYHQNRPLTESLVRRAEDAGYRAICPTLDVPVQNPKERDRRNWFLPPYDRVRYALHDESFSGLWPSGYPFGPHELEWLRGLTSLPIVPKGILSPEDARIAAELGADALLVSNHGGRMIDTAPSAIEVLPEVVQAISGRVEIYLDSGIRRGSDVLKALALGARAVGIGRPWYWGLAVGGSEGVQRVLDILRAELDGALAFCGQASVTELTAGVVAVPVGWGPGQPSAAPMPPPARSTEPRAN
jgi:4-hydroxymandelate oxidase